jgi:hypothetical protein
MKAQWEKGGGRILLGDNTSAGEVRLWPTSFHRAGVSISAGSACLYIYSADYSGRAGLRPLACWDCGFELHRHYGCLSVVSVVCCQVEVSASGWSLVQRSPTECGVSECDREASIMRKPWPTGGCCATGGKKYIYIYTYTVDLCTRLVNSDLRKIQLALDCTVRNSCISRERVCYVPL